MFGAGDGGDREGIEIGLGHHRAIGKGDGLDAVPDAGVLTDHGDGVVRALGDIQIAAHVSGEC